MRSIRYALMAAALAASLAASPQETFATLIENDASATVEVVPTIVVFHLSKQCSGDTLADAVRDARKFGPALRESLKAAGYERASVRLTGPMFPDPVLTRIHIEAEIRLSLSSGGEEGTRSTALAAAVDHVAKLALDNAAELDVPSLDVADRSASEQLAVQRAIENAYARAEAAATVMQLQIVSVDRVNIQSVTWHDRYDPDGEEASAERIGVTVAIRVAYLAMPPGN